MALSPCKALADDIDYTDTLEPLVIFNSSEDWSSGNFYSTNVWKKRSLAIQVSEETSSETGKVTGTDSTTGTLTSNMSYIVPNISGQINTSTIGGRWLWYTNDYLNGNYSHNINGTMSVSDSTTVNETVKTTGTAQITGYCSNTEPVMIADIRNKINNNGTLNMGMSYYGGYQATLQDMAPSVARKGQRFRLLYTSFIIGTCDDANGKNFTELRIRPSKYKMYVKQYGGSTPVLVQPDSDGLYTMPTDCIYLAVVFQVPNNSGLKDYLVMDAPNLILLDDRQIKEINNQTDDLMSTDGSDDIASDAMVGGKVEEIQQMDIFNLIGTIDQTVGNAVQTQDVDGSVVFPGMTMAGFTIPSYTINPMNNVDSNLRDTIKLMVTFVFCSAFISHIIRLCQCIFGIYEYGVGFENFGDGDYSHVTVNRSFKADYSIDEDLGF